MDVFDQDVPRRGHLLVQLVWVNPARRLATHRFHDNVRVILILHSELKDFKLQLPHGPQDIVVSAI